MKITVYQKPTCTPCRNVHAALVESGVDFTAVDDYLDPIAKATLEGSKAVLARPAERLEEIL